MSSKKTTLIRVRRDFRDMIKLDHPNMPIGYALEITYLKHPLVNAERRLRKLEAVLRGKKKK